MSADDDVEPEVIFGLDDDPDEGYEAEDEFPGSTPEILKVTRAELLQAIDDAELAYKTGDELPNGATLHKSANAEAVTYIDDDAMLRICFRGTEDFTTMEGIRDVLTDAKAKAENLNVALGLAFNRPRDEQGIVHVGFAQYMLELYEELTALIEEEDVPFIVTGHSLGGAAASLFALKYLQDTGTRAHRVYLVGAPKAFELFGTYFDDEIECINIINEDDPVTYVSPTFATHKGYKLVMQTVGGYDTLSRGEQLEDLPSGPLQQFEVMRSKQAEGFMDDGEFAAYNSALAKTYLGGVSNYSEAVMNLFNKLTRETIMYAITKGASVGAHTLEEYRARVQTLPNVVEWSTVSPRAKGWFELLYAASKGNSFAELMDQWNTAYRRRGPLDIARMTVRPSPAQSSLPGASVAGLSGQMVAALSSEMKIGGFIFYPEDEKNEHEFNLIYYE